MGNNPTFYCDRGNNVHEETIKQQNKQQQCLLTPYSKATHKLFELFNYKKKTATTQLLVFDVSNIINYQSLYKSLFNC